MVESTFAAKNSQLRETLVEICHRVEGKGFVVATDGNISARLPNGNIVVTPASLNKGQISVSDLMELTADGSIVSGEGKPSTETDMHVFIYKKRPDVHAVVHCHPVHATGFAVARVPLTECVFPEVIVGLGAVPLADYATPSTSEVTQSIAPFVETADAILLASHGVVTYGKDLWDAYFKMEKVEYAAHVLFVARALGGEKLLTPQQIEKLRTIGPVSYGKDLSDRIACEISPLEPEFELSDEDYKMILEEVKKRLS